MGRAREHRSPLRYDKKLAERPTSALAPDEAPASPQRLSFLRQPPGLLRRESGLNSKTQRRNAQFRNEVQGAPGRPPRKMCSRYHQPHAPRGARAIAEALGSWWCRRQGNETRRTRLQLRIRSLARTLVCRSARHAFAFRARKNVADRPPARDSHIRLQHRHAQRFFANEPGKIHANTRLQR